MDRSFLSDKAVIAASRKFVCARLATYECAAEEKLLESIFVGRSGDLENTTFTIMAPDGKRTLVRSSRGPSSTFGRDSGAATKMVAAMERIAKSHPGKRKATSGAPLPLLEDVRLGINVAACDHLPLVVVLGKNAKDSARLERVLAPLAWDDKNIGRFLYASTHKAKDLAVVSKVKQASGYVIVQSGRFGQDGSVLAQLPASATPKAIQAALDKATAKYASEALDYRSQVRAGRRAGVHWETEIPVTDPGRPPGGRRGPPR
jgi:hypothetical protein